MQPVLMSQAAYAEHRGVTKQAINKQVKAGKIPVDANGKIDAAAADLALENRRAAHAAMLLKRREGYKKNVSPRPRVESGVLPKEKRTTKYTRPDLSEVVYGMITAKNGAAMSEIINVTGWVRHSVRARISEIERKHKLTIIRDRILGELVYRATHRDGQILNWP